MENEGKQEQLKILVERVNKNLGDIKSMDMIGLPPYWPTFEEKARAIYDDLRILLPLAKEIQPYMMEEINTLKVAVVNMRINAYNQMSDIVHSEATGKPVHQEVEACPAMIANSITDPNSKRGIEFCLNECPYQIRCIAIEPGEINHGR